MITDIKQFSVKLLSDLKDLGELDFTKNIDPIKKLSIHDLIENSIELPIVYGIEFSEKHEIEIISNGYIIEECIKLSKESQLNNDISVLRKRQWNQKNIQIALLRYTATEEEVTLFKSFFN